MIHFCLIQNRGKPYTGIIGHLRRYLKNVGLNETVNYKIFEFDDNRSKRNPDTKVERLGEYIPGKSVVEIIDLEAITKLINNYYSGVDLLDGIEYNDKQKKLLDDILDYYKAAAKNLDIVCFSVFEPYLFHNILAALFMKQLNPSIKIIFGGVHMESSVKVSRLLSVLEPIDYVVIGDVSPGVVDCLTTDVESPHYPEYIDMDLTHPVIYNEKDIEIIRQYSSHDSPGFWMNGVRGCSNKCGYCVNSSVKFRFASVDAISESVKFLNSLSDEMYLHINDNLVNYSRRRMHNFLDCFIENNNKLPVEIFAVFKFLDKDIIDKMAAANVKIAMMSFEGHVDDETFCGKCSSNYQNDLDKIKMMMDKGIMVVLFGVFGAPTEARRIFERGIQTFETVIAQYPEIFMILYSYDHLAGSGLYLSPEQYDITYKYWDEQIFVEHNDELNNIITTIPKTFHYNYPFDEYQRRRKIVQNTMLKYASLGD